jgi:hypothetical protein
MVKFTRSEVADLKKFGKGIKETIGKSPPEGLIPIGGGIYITPKGPADPRDCDRYPDSPYCGGNPFSAAPVALEPDIGFDECGGYFSVTPVLGFTRMPVATIAHRKDTPECRREPEPPPELPPPTPGEFRFIPPPVDVKDEDNVFIFMAYDRVRTTSTLQHPECVKAGFAPVLTQVYTYTAKWLDYFCPGVPTQKSGMPFFPEVSGIGTAQNSLTNLANVRVGGRECVVDRGPDIVDRGTSSMGFNAGGLFYRYFVDADSKVGYYYNSSNQITMIDSSLRVVGEIQEYQPFNGDSYLIVKGNWKLIKQRYSRGTAEQNVVSTCHCDLVVKVGCGHYNPHEKNPPPPLPKKRNCCVTCCTNPNTDRRDQTQDAILALVRKINDKVGNFPANVTVFDSDENKQEAQSQSVSLGSVSQAMVRAIERIEKVSKIIGIDALPLTVPDSICDPVENNLVGAIWDFVTGDDNTRKINNLFEYHVWFLEQFSAVLGHWQMDLEVQDTDVLKSGNQGLPGPDGQPQPPPPNKKIVLPDVRTALKEQMLLQIGTYKTLGLVLDVVIKDLTQDCATYKEVIAVQQNLKEMIDFLDYPTDEKYVDVTTQITVPGVDVSQEQQNDLGKYLQPGITKVRYQSWTGYKSLSDLFTHLATLSGRGKGG